jgi:hypothetical protein
MICTIHLSRKADTMEMDCTNTWAQKGRQNEYGMYSTCYRILQVHVTRNVDTMIMD